MTSASKMTREERLQKLQLSPAYGGKNVFSWAYANDHPTNARARSSPAGSSPAGSSPAGQRYTGSPSRQRTFPANVENGTSGDERSALWQRLRSSAPASPLNGSSAPSGTAGAGSAAAAEDTAGRPTVTTQEEDELQEAIRLSQQATPAAHAEDHDLQESLRLSLQSPNGVSTAAAREDEDELQEALRLSQQLPTGVGTAAAHKDEADDLQEAVRRSLQVPPGGNKVVTRSLPDTTVRPLPPGIGPHLPVDLREQLETPRMPSDLGLLLEKLGQRHPDIVREIIWTSGSTLKFQYLQACIHEKTMDDKSKSQELWRSLPKRDQLDLSGAFELGDGERNKFFLQIAEEDRHMREKLEGQARVAWADNIGGATKNSKGLHDSCIDSQRTMSDSHGTAEGGLARLNTTASSSAAGSSLERLREQVVMTKDRTMEGTTGYDGTPLVTKPVHSQQNTGWFRTQDFDAPRQKSPEQIPLMKRWVQSMLRQHSQPEGIFRALDKDHDGLISYEELGGSFRLVEPNCLEVELLQIFKSMDSYSSGYVNKAQLLAAIGSCFPSGKSDSSGIGYGNEPVGSKLTGGQQNDGLPSAQGFDVANHLQPSQMQLVKRWVQSMRRQHVQPGEMFRALDKDGDGRLSYEELGSFFRLLEPNCMEMDLMKIFERMDCHKVGFVTADELQDVIESCDPTFRRSKYMSPASPTKYSWQVQRDSSLSPSKGAALNPHVLVGLPPSKQDQAAGRERLNRLLFTHGVEECRVIGDGNCQFRALAHQLFGSEVYHGDVRKEVVSRLKSFPASYHNFVPSGYPSYVSGMALSGTWGDHVTLQAAADRFGVEIKVFSDYERSPILMVWPAQKLRPDMISISFHAEHHYNSIRRQWMASSSVSSPDSGTRLGGSRTRCSSATR
mmetsp:Transcript_71330/g.127188  ORF Transcript_71330/g.127188 Transcript_71330/m.127188 type:complete len:898 (+) Transcript_71330:69-2762(+)